MESTEYEFETRDPATYRCLICDGTGEVPIRKKLPDGTKATDCRKPKPLTMPPTAGSHKEQAKKLLQDTNAMDIFSSTLKEIAGSEITAKVTIVYITGSRAEVLETIKDII